MKMVVFLLHRSSQHHSSRAGRVLRLCCDAADNGSAVFLPQGWGITGKGFDEGNPRDGSSALSASLFLKLP